MKLFLFCETPTTETSLYDRPDSTRVYGVIIDGIFPINSAFSEFTASCIEYETGEDKVEIGFVLTFYNDIIYPLPVEIAGKKLLDIKAQNKLTAEVITGNNTLTLLNAKRWETLKFGDITVDLYKS